MATQMSFANPLDAKSDEDDEPDGNVDGQGNKRLQAVDTTSRDMLSGFQEMAEQVDGDIDMEELREQRIAEAYQYMEENFIIAPDSDARHRWDILQLPLLIYVAVAIPYRIGFSHDTSPWEALFIFDIFVDLFFVIDIGVSFRTAVWNKHGELDYLPAKISQQYIKSWFVVDVLGCLPISYVMLLFDTDLDDSASRSNKFFRVLRLFKLLKLLRLVRLKRMVARYEEEFYALASGFAIVKIVICVGIIGHWLACLWFGVGEVIDVDALSADGARLLTWTEIHFGEYVCEDGSQIAVAPELVNSDADVSCAESTVCSEQCAVFRSRCKADGTCEQHPTTEDKGEMMDRYLTSLYWAFMTMTTVGYGDIPARTNYEKWAAVLGMLIGGFTFGLIVGALGEMARKANPGETFRTKKIGQISAYLAKRQITPDLLRRIRLYFQNHYEIASVFAANEYQDYFLRLPAESRLQLAKEIGYLDSSRKPGILARVTSMSGLDTMSLVLVCTKLKTELFDKSVQLGTKPRESIVRRGENAWEMLVVLDGIVNASEATTEKDVRDFLLMDDEAAREHEQQLKSGGFIDEHVALLPPHTHHQRSHTLYAQSDCSIALLSAEDVAMLRSERSEIDRHLRPYAAAVRSVKYLSANRAS
eukprot:COSAG02_NODE_796_length_17128_cov_176.587586_8_plen_645_part_00